MKAYKSALSVILCLVLLLSTCIMGTATAETTPAHSTADEIPVGIEYTINGDGVSVSGYSGTADEIIIPAFIEGLPVTEIGYCAFDSNSSIKSVILPDTIKAVGESTFSYCANLESVTLCEGVETIGESAFENCESLKSLVIPSTVTDLGSWLFANCISLESVTLPVGISEIKEHSFDGCASLDEVAVPEGVTAIEEEAFSNCWSLKNITLPDSLTAIGDGAFGGCQSLETLAIPANVTAIGKLAFSFCNALESVEMSEKLSKLGERAFSNCQSLESIALPESLTEIGRAAFYNCESLADVYYAGTEFDWNNIKMDSNATLLKATVHFAKENPDPTEPLPTDTVEVFETEDGFKYTVKDGGAVLVGYTATNDEVVVPAVLGGVSVTAIGERAFENMDFIKSLTLPEGVKTVEAYAFCLCTNLQHLNIPESLEKLDAFAFYGCDSVATVTYAGNRKQWKAIDFSVGNDALKNLTHYDIDFLGEVPVTRPTSPVTVPEPEPQKNRFYIYMPEPWLDPEGWDSIGVYWEGDSAPEDSRGYEAPRTAIPNLYYYDVPEEVEEIVFNNFYNGPWSLPARTYKIKTTGYDQNESDSYPWGIDSFDGMIYVIHSGYEKVRIDEINVEYIFDGEWYYYYGNGEYGLTPEKGKEFYTANYLDAPLTPDFEAGDVNRDENLNIKDATLIQKFIAKMVSLSPAQQALADFNADGKINVKDATAIQKKIAKIY